ncbi:excinuclease ABC subunit C [Terriglobus aquaticus]|uniref:Excinuclease ABC subunit C n=1 Tax=Terriglobus aquaticus TaxID=940139 RepID=A0ABW9KIJ6_9BACT|nr:excinuclease ABC subunit C [Terriglobus aquaticus]
MSVSPIFEHELSFSPELATEVLRAVPARAGVVALFGHSSTDRPFLMQSANLRRRLQRLLLPPEGQTKRLNLRDRVARVAWRETGSELESLLLLYRAMRTVFGADEARRKLRLSPPFTVRYAVENRFPRIYVTNHLRRRSLHTTFGPFASRLDAERYREAVEDLFVIRRCFLELHPSPDDPGCIYGEMHKCMAPCQQRCTDAEYHREAERALQFLNTAGQSLAAEHEAERDRASADMLFEQAAAAHARAAKAKSTGAIADALVGPLDRLRAVLLVPLRVATDVPQVQVFLFADGCLRGPELVSVLGVRLAKEQVEVGSSLFAQPRMMAAVALDAPGQHSEASSANAANAAELSPEERMLAVIAKLEDTAGASDTATLGDHLAMLRRWYYRPEKQRAGVLFQPERDAWPVRKLVRAAAKLAAPEPQVQPAPAEGDARSEADPRASVEPVTSSEQQ